MPAAYAAADDAGLNVSAYICNPSERAVSGDARAAMESLLIELGEIEPKPDVDAGSHCDNCIIGLAALTRRAKLPASVLYEITQHRRIDITAGFFYQAQGPPLGGRAPPTL